MATTRTEQEIARNKKIRERVEKVRERSGYSASQKNDAMMAYFDII
jgi:hypothetical protein